MEFETSALLSPVEEIKNRLDIIEIISGYIKLTKAGRNWRANCPFHAEKTPSFMVSPERQIWHCFGCGKGGDIFGFVKEIEGLEFIDALRLLAQRAGVVLKKQDPKLKSAQQRLLEICELSTKFFEKQLSASKVGEKIKKYLQDRGINKHSISQWRIGFAPNDWEALSKFLQSRGYNDKEIIASGVVVEKEKSQSPNSNIQYYDRFRNRIIFPIFDINKQVIGFAGRVAPGEDEKSAKYINTPQTAIYDKGRIIYGLQEAKKGIRDKDYCVLVEGNTDVIIAHQADFKNTIASSGTALTPNHLKIIKRYTNNLILAFDMDLAGEMAAKRAIDLGIQEGFNIKIIIPTSKARKQDPADIIKDDPKKWEKVIANSVGIVEYYFNRAFVKFNPNEVNGKKEIARMILPLLKKIPDKIEQNHWAQELASRLKTSEKIIIDAMKSAKTKEASTSRPSSTPTENIKPQNRLSHLEEEIIGLIVISPSPADIAKELKKEKISFNRPSLDEIFSNLIQYLEKLGENQAFDTKKWQDKLPPELNLILEQILFKLEIQHSDIDNFPKHLHNCLIEFYRERIRGQMIKLRMEIKECEKNQDAKKLSEHLDKFQQLTNKIKNNQISYGEEKTKKS